MAERTRRPSDPGVLEALCDDDAMRAWYRLRTALEPLPVSSVANDIGAAVDLAHRARDLLESAGFVRKLPARGRRRTITYEVAVPELVVQIPDESDGDPRCQQLHAAFSRRDREVIERTRRFRQSSKGEWFFDQVTDFAPTKEEILELQRRVYEVSRYVLEIAGKVRVPAEPAVLLPRHALRLRIAALEGCTAPLPQVRILTNRAARQQQRGRVAAPESVGAREREIAQLLQSGLSRPEIARRLGISPQTVGTYCKRLFSKLAIRRAIELSR
jgi:DNA-binding CsgD family transcriptional regulator